MKVLLTQRDIENGVGGGQTVYRRLIARNPGIEFAYIASQEAASGAGRAPNTRAIPPKDSTHESYFHSLDRRDRTLASAFSRAANLAAAVAGESFDIVESPDYDSIGPFLPAALAAQGVQFGKVVLSLHGVASHPQRNAWYPGYYAETMGVDLDALETLESDQFRMADARYGISLPYVRAWRERTGIAVATIDPLALYDAPSRGQIGAPISKDALPTLSFIGRLDANKGPDLFIELASLLAPQSYERLAIYGPDTPVRSDMPAGRYLADLARRRGLSVHIAGALGGVDMQRLFVERMVTCVTSRWDPFNLVALESLLAGCPTAIDRSCGVRECLDAALPHVPYTLLDHGDMSGSAANLAATLAAYDDRRAGLREALDKTDWAQSVGGADLAAVYDSAPGRQSSELEGRYAALYEQLASVHAAEAGRLRSPRAQVAGLIPDTTRHAAFALRKRPKATVQQAVLRGASRLSRNPLLIEQLRQARSAAGEYAETLLLPEVTDRQVEAKVAALSRYWHLHKFDRVRLMYALARLERRRGNEMVAATYLLRVLRWMGRDALGICGETVGLLEGLGFHAEAEASSALYGEQDGRGSESERYRLLAEQFERRRKPTEPDRALEILDRSREAPGPAPRVSVIVSLYNAAAKLPRFLLALNAQTMVAAGRLEVVLVDSGSPSGERAVYLEIADRLLYPVCYARSAERETIQAAWNRGIGLARAEYLAFLGVDETVAPDCYETLATELDNDAQLDWVTGSSLINEVGMDGAYLHDDLFYDRAGYAPHLIYLETCWLSWVGALYRKSIHSRFGYYDPTFRAAGDTEFKGRVLPHIRTKAIARTLGRFWNYPDERTTAHPRAEIEDVRAWYLHRSDAGMRYAFAQRSVEDANTLLRACLDYRKSYQSGSSTDFDLASSVISYLRRYRRTEAAIRDWQVQALDALAAYRRMDYVDPLTGREAVRSLLAARRAVAALERRGLTASQSERLGGLFSDNRYEQHSSLW